LRVTQPSRVWFWNQIRICWDRLVKKWTEWLNKWFTYLEPRCANGRICCGLSLLVGEGAGRLLPPFDCNRDAGGLYLCLRRLSVRPSLVPSCVRVSHEHRLCWAGL
jgi:hypothetical protein